MGVEWFHAARRDLMQAFRHIAQDDLQAAHKVLNAIEARASLLGDNPELGRTGRVRSTRERVIAGTPYIVANRVRSGTVQVLRLLHGDLRWPVRM